MRLLSHIIYWFASAKTAVILLSVILIVCIIGVFLPEGIQPKLYYSVWFILLILSLAINLIFCSIRRIILKSKNIASLLTHLSVILILLGALISYVWAIRGVLELEEGQTKDRILRGCSFYRLGFKVRLDDFSIAWYEQRPQLFELDIRIKDISLRKRLKLKENQQITIDNTNYKIQIIDYLPDFARSEQGEVFSRSDMPRNPAVRIRITTDQFTEERWLFSNHPMMTKAKDENIKIRFSWMPTVKEFRSSLSILDEKGNIIAQGLTKVNAPFSYKGYNFYQSGYDLDNPYYSSLEVVRDPGVKFVFGGFILLNIGLFILFYPKMGLPNLKFFQR
ncbi:MAG: cytochrome c biogenesis protein ResB [Candidatus Omnitrophica bacterium]|nr:cytochrome c biogenesis protein ResB [Candidatus Omnitrophota bacterium]